MYIKGFDMIRRDRGGCTGGGIAIIIKNGLKYQRIKNFYNCGGKVDVCAISMYINKVKTLLAVGYRPQTNISLRNHGQNSLTSLQGTT
jgi:hypothetical protein